MKIVVITGSTRGIGYGLAESFLNLDCGVVISGRSLTGVDQAVARLSEGDQSRQILGVVCDITQADQVETLWQKAVRRFDRVDIWINNAGIAHNQMLFREHQPEQIVAVVQTNIIGTMFGARVALNGLSAQGYGALYIMAGHGATGRKQDGLTLYGSTKYALRYLTECLVEEVKGTPIIVGELRPGMVLTELLTDQFKDRPEDWEKAKPIFNIIVDRTETVTPWLAQKVLDNDKNGAEIVWLTKAKMLGRFLTAPLGRRNVVE
jgi:NAD(P)-dependent dehydrogenase (short-subunit alcohol dehydrogenase family)